MPAYFIHAPYRPDPAEGREALSPSPTICHRPPVPLTLPTDATTANLHPSGPDYAKAKHPQLEVRGITVIYHGMSNFMLWLQ